MHTTIGIEDLDRVIGGAATTSTSPTSTTSRCGTTSDTLMQTLNTLQTSLSNLNNPNNNGGLHTTPMLFLAPAPSAPPAHSGHVAPTRSSHTPPAASDRPR